MKKILACLAVISPCIAQAEVPFADCLDYFPNKTPPKITLDDNTKALCFEGFAVLYSGKTKTPIFVVEKLNRARLADAKDEERTNKFYEEARLPSHMRATLADYAGSGYDRGHMAPAADMPNPKAMAQSFSLANMIPEVPEHNRGLWAKQVEKPTRQYVNRTFSGDVYVYTGPVFYQGYKTIGPGKVGVPQKVFKLVYDESKQKTWAYWTDNSADQTLNPPISYKQLTQNIGYSLIPSLAPNP